MKKMGKISMFRAVCSQPASPQSVRPWPLKFEMNLFMHTKGRRRDTISLMQHAKLHAGLMRAKRSKSSCNR